MLTADQTYDQLWNAHGTVFGTKLNDLIFQAGKDYPEHPGIQSAVAHRYLSLGRLEESRAAIAIFLDIHDDDVDVAQASIDFFAGEMDRSSAVFDRVLAQNPMHKFALMSACYAASRANDDMKLKKLLFETDQRYPENAPLMQIAIQMYESVGDQANADAIFERFRYVHGRPLGAIEAQRLMEDHDWISAEKVLKEQLSVWPGVLTSLEILGHILFVKGEYDEANHLLTSVDQTPQMLIILAQIARQLGQPDTAAELEKRAKQAPSSNEDSELIRQAGILFRAANYDESFSIFRKILQSPSVSIRRIGAVRALKYIGVIPECPGAFELLKEIESKGIDTDRLAVAQAMHLYSLGDFTGAIEIVNRALIRFPKSVDLFTAKFKILGQIGSDQEFSSLANQVFPIVMNSPLALAKCLTAVSSHRNKVISDRYENQLRREFPKSMLLQSSIAVRDLSEGRTQEGQAKLTPLCERSGINQVAISKLAKERYERDQERENPKGWKRFLKLFQSK